MSKLSLLEERLFSLTKRLEGSTTRQEQISPLKQYQEVKRLINKQKEYQKVRDKLRVNQQAEQMALLRSLVQVQMKLQQDQLNKMEQMLSFLIKKIKP